MSDQTKGKQIKDQKEKKSVGIASGHTTPARSKRPFTEVANSSAEEIVLLSNQVEEISLDVKALGQNVTALMSKSDAMMTKADMKAFIKSTVEEIMNEINTNIEMTVDIKVTEKTKQLKEEIDILREENGHLKSKLISMQKNSETLQKVANQALEKSNQNEQYSRKNNIKILNIKEEVGEDETTLQRSVCPLLDQQNIALSPQQVVAIHRIPGKSDSPKPVLMKVIINCIKTMIMKKRKTMKSSGHRLVDDVTRLNTALITRLNEHPNIDSAWYFNDSVYEKTTAGKRLKFDLHDDNVIAKSVRSADIMQS